MHGLCSKDEMLGADTLLSTSVPSRCPCDGVLSSLSLAFVCVIVVGAVGVTVVVASRCLALVGTNRAAILCSCCDLVLTFVLTISAVAN